MASFKLPTDYSTRPVAVLGGGVLGRRIAACWTAAGYNVRIRDPVQASREDALQYVAENLSVYTAKTKRQAGHCEATEDVASAVDNCWLVIEAVPEKLTIKEATFVNLEQHAPKDCILASNSSSYRSRDLVGKIGDETKARVLNTHYYMPPASMVVELMTCGSTAPEIFPFLVERQREAGTQPLVAKKESTGFIFNRIWAAIKREVLHVLADGVSDATAIDQTFKGWFGAERGPAEMMDNVGLDTVAFIEEHYVKELGLERSHLDWLNREYVKEGRLGRKSEKGGLLGETAA